ncbi:MAG: NifU family protein [Alphaproteobacteria bacterium]|nr:NifU family protein [Alphaproteobacteria bacterium]
MYIETEDTPNPQSLKFTPDCAVLGLGPDRRPAVGRDFPTPASAARAPLAEAMFAIDGVEGVFLGPDFVTVTKSESQDWPALKPTIIAAIADHLASGAPVVLPDDGSGPASHDRAATPLEDYEGEDREVVEQIIELIDTRVRPAVAADGGDIVFKHYEPRTGVVFLSLHGSCQGCPSSTMTLKAGIENMLKHYVPEVVKVEPIA